MTTPVRRLTVVQLLPALHAGGVERSTLEIAGALVRKGHRAIVVSAGGRLVQPLLDACAEARVNVEKVATMQELGKACGSHVGAATAAILKG